MPTTHRADRTGAWSLVVGPLLLLGSVVTWYVSDQLIDVDKATVGWALVVPMALLAPGVLGLAWSSPGTARRGRLLLAVVSLVIAAVTILGLAATVTWLDCASVTDRLAVAARALPVGVVAGLAFAVPTLIAGRLAARGGFLRTIAAGAAGFAVGLVAVLAAFLVAFPILSCAAPVG
jgi:hypothetical protein